MISLFWVPSKRYPMGNYKVECVLHQTNKQNSARARRTKNIYSSKVHPIYGCTLCSFTEPFSGTSGGRARRARRALVRVKELSSQQDRILLARRPVLSICQKTLLTNCLTTIRIPYSFDILTPRVRRLHKKFN